MEHREANDAQLEQERREAAAKLIEEGRALLDRGEIDAAIRTFDEATSLDEHNGAAWNDLAVALYQAGRNDMAIGCLYTSLRVDPTFADAAINLATLLDVAGRPADGIPGLRGALFHDPEQEDVRETLEALGVTKPRQVAIVAIDSDLDTYRVVSACLTEWQHLVTAPEAGWVGAFGDLNDVTTWQRYLAAVQPATIIADAAHPATANLQAAAATLGVNVAVLGEELPTGAPLVELAQALTGEIPSARATWDDVERPAPPLTVSVPLTHIAHAINLLDRLANQDLPPGLFEVVAADRAWGEPATSLVEPGEVGFDLNILRMEGVGLGEARQAILEASRGAWTVFFDEETRPSPENLGQHLRTQVTNATTEAVLGDFRMHPNLVDNSLRKLIDTSGLLWAQPDLVDGTVHGGAAFRANNVSVPTGCLTAVGGFDALFSAGCEDTDIGVRMERQLDVHVRYDASIKAEMDYPFTVGDLQIEQLVRGWACVHLAEKHEDPRFLIDPSQEVLDTAWFAERRRQAEANAAQATDLARRVQDVCHIEEPYRKTGAAEHMDPIARVIGMQAFNRGIAIAHSGFRLEDERMPGALASVATPVIIRSGGDVAATLGSMAMTEGEIVVYCEDEITAPDGITVRRGGITEALATEAPAIAWVEAGTVLPPDWRMTLLTELESWPDIGAVVPTVAAAPTTNRPKSPPAMVIHRGVLERMGDATTDLGSPAAAERIQEIGFHVVTSEACLVETSTRLLEQTA